MNTDSNLLLSYAVLYKRKLMLLTTVKKRYMQLFYNLDFYEDLKNAGEIEMFYVQSQAKVNKLKQKISLFKFF